MAKAASRPHMCLVVIGDFTSKAIETTAERRARQAIEGSEAMREYQANAAATRLRTEQLRAARLAQEAAQQDRKSTRLNSSHRT